MKRDPLESQNLIQGPSCAVHFDQFDTASVEKILGVDVGRATCLRVRVSGSSDNGTGGGEKRRTRRGGGGGGRRGGSVERETREMNIDRNRESESNSGGGDSRDKEKIVMDVETETETETETEIESETERDRETGRETERGMMVERQHRNLSLSLPLSRTLFTPPPNTEQCTAAYRKDLVLKISALMKKLSVFVRYGNVPHTRLMEEIKAAEGKMGGQRDGYLLSSLVTCSTPLGSDLKGLKFEYAAGE